MNGVDNMTQQTEPILQVKQLVTQFRTKNGYITAVDGVSFTVRKGETLGIVGESGCGKSVTSLSILRLLPSGIGRIAQGEVIFKGEDLVKKSNKELSHIRGKDIAMIFQDSMTSLNPVLTVERQISEVIEKHEKLSRSEALDKARQMLELVGIPGERGKEYPHQFSGGMKQRVVIAMALACNPDLLIADEPTTALDVTIQAQVLDMMKKLREQNGTSMLMITHDLGIVAEVCDCVSVIYAGRVVEHGTLEDVFDHTLHPYTKGLFNSLPNMKDRKARLQPIPGLMPDPSRLPEGCAFADRCRYATDRCFHERPEVLHRTEEHTVACHLYTPENIQKGGVLDHE